MAEGFLSINPSLSDTREALWEWGKICTYLLAYCTTCRYCRASDLRNWLQWQGGCSGVGKLSGQISPVFHDKVPKVVLPSTRPGNDGSLQHRWRLSCKTNLVFLAPTPPIQMAVPCLSCLITVAWAVYRQRTKHRIISGVSLWVRQSAVCRIH